MSKDLVRQALQILFWKWNEYYDNGIHIQSYYNKLAKLGDAIAISNLKLWMTHSLKFGQNREI